MVCNRLYSIATIGVLNDLFSQISIVMSTAPSYKSEQMVRT